MTRTILWKKQSIQIERNQMKQYRLKTRQEEGQGQRQRQRQGNGLKPTHHVELLISSYTQLIEVNTK